MKLSILLVLTALFVLVSGFQNPALFFIGYLWASVLYPAAFSDTFVSLSLVFGIFAVLGYGFIDKKEKGPLPTVFYIAVAFAVWVTLTSFYAQRPFDAWPKWNWAIQSILITVAIPLFLRTRAQIETAFIAVYSAIVAHVMTAAIKSIIGTAGYDRLGRLMMNNFWLGETSTLSLVAILSIPMAYYILEHSLMLEQYRNRYRFYFRAMFGIYIVLAIECMIGTSARTGIFALAVLLTFGAKSFLKKALVLLSAAIIFYFAQPFITGRSLERYSTITTYKQDSSATTRIAVWNWAIKYAEGHPLGGGFGLFNGANIDFQTEDANGQIITQRRIGTAAHSIYFEVLGEQGYPGIFLFLASIVTTMFGTYRISRLPQDKEKPIWYISFSRTLFVCLIIFAVSASFVGIAFQPMLYVILGFHCSVYRSVRRERTLQPKFSAKLGFPNQTLNQSRA
jgi:probable O-glycosylation ligase (exosortase A-associated)